MSSPTDRPADPPAGRPAGRPISRRALLGAGVAGGLGIVVAGGVNALHNGGGSSGATATTTATPPTTSGPPLPAPGTASAKVAGYGPLVPDPNGRLALPEGFRYRLIAEQGVTTLESGEPSPSQPDGAAAFAAATGGSALVCNHEIEKDKPQVPHVDGLVYDPKGRGGTTTIEFDADGEVVGQYVSLAGTVDNCAGGRTPWDTWLSCEETEAVLSQPHGYVFEVDPFDRAANRDPRPIKALGRYAHEAVVVDPEDSRLYLTEDARRPNGLLYRWTPPAEAVPLGKGSLRTLADDAGVLEALRAETVDGRVVADLSEATEIGTVYRAGWVEVPDRDASSTSTRKQFGDGEITRGRKLEGMWWGDGGAYVVSSYAREKDGDARTHDGQVWFLDPRAGTLRLHLQFAPTTTPEADPDGPDNITVSPYGGVLIAEDSKGRPHLLGATPGGEVFVMAQSEQGKSEFCGPTFSPDRRTLYVNLQGPGQTYAIDGPFADST